ncbi:MAG: hypothetical protein DRJ50_10205 [Actinobacteria bacterium]|nr:MAG: hypothetical protein DRJ50_10205 [Actinomycetota bacterium]
MALISNLERLLPRRKRPSVVMRRNAMQLGVFGPSRFWKMVAAAMFGRKALKKVFGRTPQNLGIRTIGVGSMLTVAVFKPMTRKERKRRGITLSAARSDAAAELEAVPRAS